MNTGVINLFEENLYWHMIIQGCFFSICFMIGISILFHSLQNFLNIPPFTKEFNQIRKIKKYVNQTFTVLFSALLETEKSPENKKDLTTRIASLLNFLPVILVFVIITFVFGILTNRLGDNFSDNGNCQHLGLKSMWMNGNFDDTDTTIKIKSFDNVFPQKIQLSTELKKQMYYDMKHRLLENELWRNYLSTSQTLINYSQVLLFSFFNLIIILIIDFFLNFITSLYSLIAKKDEKSKKNEKNVKAFVISLTISLFSIAVFIYLLLRYGEYTNSWLFFLGLLLIHIIIIIVQRKLTFSNMLFRFAFICIMATLYYAAGISWAASEKEFDCKVFGVYKANYKNTYRRDLEWMSPSSPDINAVITTWRTTQ